VSSIGLDFHGIVLPVVGSDHLVLVVEEPLLNSLSLSVSLQIDLACSNSFSNSVHWKSRDYVEWPVDVETEFFIESFTCNFLCLVKIDNLPSLVGTIMSVPNDNLLTFNIFALEDIKAFLVLPVDEVFIRVGEDLPPSRVGAPDLHVLVSS